jgi:hypothetical protein
MAVDRPLTSHHVPHVATVSRLRAHWGDLALVALVLAVAGPVVQDLRAQQASRLALTAAIVDDGSLRIDDYPIGVDRAEHDGHVYSDKAPGQPVFAIPAYAAYRWLGGEPATVRRVEGNLGLWTVTLWSSVLPVAVLLLLVRRVADEVAPGTGLPVAALTYVATLLLPFSSLLFGHALSACLAFAGWFAIRRADLSNRALVAAGALLGAAVLVEYTMVLAAALIGLAVLRLVGHRVWLFASGAAPFALALGAYQWAAFGSPFAFSYASSSFGEASRAKGLEELDPPLIENSVRVLVGERGLFVVCPIVLLAAIGMALLLRERRGNERIVLLAAASSAVSLVAVQMAWSNPTGGDSPGPRYAVAAIAFVAPGLALAAKRWPVSTAVIGALSAVVMLSATWTDPLATRDSTGAIRLWLQDFFAGKWALTVYEMATGRWAAVLLAVIGAAACAGVVAAHRHRAIAAPPTRAPSPT